MAAGVVLREEALRWRIAVVVRRVGRRTVMGGSGDDGVLGRDGGGRGRGSGG